VYPSPTPSFEPRPLALVVPRRDADALVFDLGDREIRVAGDPDLVADLLGRCDGRSSAAQILDTFDGDVRTEVEQLLADLLGHGVLVDATGAHRHFHRHSSSDSGLFRALTEEQLRDLRAERFEPRSVTEIGEPLPPPSGALQELAARRTSSLPGAERPVSFAELSQILRAAYRTGDGPRPVPSAGGLFPLVIHVLLAAPVAPLEPGLWWYDPASAELRFVRARRDRDDTLIVPLPTTDELVAAGGPLIFLSADVERPARKYSNRGYRYALMEAGAAMQNAYLAAAELAVPIRAVGGFHDAGVHDALDLPAEVRPLLALVLGS
jgi:SagB-type dehydrogenase family enzyme